MFDPVVLQANVAAIAQSVNTVWVLLASFLIFLMQPGFALLEAGQVRAKNVANVAMKNMMDWSLGILVYFFLGLGLAGIVGSMTSPGAVTLGSSFRYISDPGSWIGWLFGGVFAMTAATIVSGAVAERVNFDAYVIFIVAITAIIYPVVQGLTWQGGLLSGSGYLGQALGVGYLDFAGGTIVHMVGGIAGLVAAKMIGPREGRFDEAGNAQPIPGHSVFLALLGTFVLAFGWYGFNVGTQATVLTTEGVFKGDALGRVAINTTLGMGAGAVASAAVTAYTRGDPDPLFTANGLLAGLVGVTSACAHVTWWGGLLIGALCGALVMPTYQWALEDLQIDDVCGVFAVHGGAGGIGAVLIPVFAVGSGGQWAPMGVNQFVMQFAGVGVIGTWTVLATIAAFLLIGSVLDLRVSSDDEADGLDAAEHNISAYPEFNVSRTSSDDNRELTGSDESGPDESTSASGNVSAESETMWRGESIDTDSGPVTVAREALVTSLTRPALVFDDDGTILHANDEVTPYLDPVTDGGVTADPDHAATDYGTLAAFDPEIRDRLEGVLDSGERIESVETTVTRNGEQREIRLAARRVHDGREAGALAVFEDITERAARRREQESLIAYRDEAITAHEERLQALADGDLDLDSYVPTPPEEFDSVIDAHGQFESLDGALMTVVENVHAIVEKLPDQSAELADRSESLNDLSDEVREVTAKSDSLTQDIRDEIQTLADEASETATIVSDQTAAIEQISSSTAQISNQSAEATEMTEEAVSEVDDAVSQIRDATEVSKAVTEDIESLDERMGTVENIVTIINDIADQTNILALNASIEAARAGQEGEGFAVVANEVKSLAEETQEQADDIASIITELKAETESVVDNIQTANDQVTATADELTTVVDTLEDTKERVAETNHAIDEIDGAVERQAEDASKMSAEIENVSSRASVINDSIDDISENIARQTEAVGTVSETADDLEVLAADMDANVDAFSTEAQQAISAGD